MSYRVATVNEAELVIRIMEAAMFINRPPDKDPMDIVAELDPVQRAMWLSAGRAALEYIEECINESQSVN